MEPSPTCCLLSIRFRSCRAIIYICSTRPRLYIYLVLQVYAKHESLVALGYENMPVQASICMRPRRCCALTTVSYSLIVLQLSMNEETSLSNKMHSILNQDMQCNEWTSHFSLFHRLYQSTVFDVLCADNPRQVTKGGRWQGRREREQKIPIKYSFRYCHRRRSNSPSRYCAYAGSRRTQCIAVDEERDYAKSRSNSRTRNFRAMSRPYARSLHHKYPTSD